MSDAFRIESADSVLPALADLMVRNLPSRRGEHEVLAELAPVLNRVVFRPAGTLWLDNTGPAVRSMTLTAADIGDPAQLPATLDSLTFRLARGTDEDIARLLSEVHQVESLSLRGTPVADAVFAVLERYDLHHLDLVDTATTAAGRPRYRADHPETVAAPADWAW